MKRKDLYNYIKEEIVGTLTETGTAMVTSKAGTKSIPFNNPAELNSLKSDSNVSSIVTTSGQKLKETDLEEMANKADIIKIQNPEKFALAKEIYTAGKTGALLSAVETAGEEGITKTNLGTTLNVRDSELSSIINSLRAAGVLSPKREKGAGAAEEEPELPTLTPDEEPEEDDWEVQKTAPSDFETPEEETPEEKPEIVNDKEVEKDFGKTNAELSPEEEETYSKYKTAITNKLKILLDIGKKSSTDDKKIAQVTIDKYKENDTIKKIFAKKGRDLISYIDTERKELIKSK
jgi:hypothetical protein